MSQKQYARVVAHCRQMAVMQSTLALLEWDQQTYLPGAAEPFRVEQVTWLAGELHRRKVDAQFGDDLMELSESPWLSSVDASVHGNIRQLTDDFKKAQRLPQKLVEQLAQACASGQMTWVMARKENSFSMFLPSLQKIFELKREQAEAVGYTESPYDALLDDYEPGAKSAEIGQVLRELCTALVPLIQNIAQSKHVPDVTLLHRTFPIASQESLGRLAAEKIGFDFKRGRLDVTHHPFCTELGPHDCRITTRYDEHFFNTSFFGILHEAGHGIYEQGLNTTDYGLPSGKFASLGVHESQSRLWENTVGRDRQFWKYFFPLAQQHFPVALGDVSEGDFYRAVNSVQSSLIRVEADEVTYNLHIAIRFELERDLIEGNLTCDDLPSAWNEKYLEYLAIQPHDFAEGVLQDIHWSAGLIGYFPTYSLGNLYAAQIFEAAERELGDLPPRFATGDFLPLRKWLNEQVHAPGQSQKPTELMQTVTGAKLSHEALLRSLTRKYQDVYQL